MSVAMVAVLVFAAALAGPTSSDVVVGSGNVVAETRRVGSFDELELATVGTVVLTQGSETALTVEGEDNIVSEVRTDVRGNRLTLDFKPGSYRLTRPLTFYVTVTDVSLLRLSGSGTLEAVELRADRLELDVSGSGGATIDRLTAPTFAVKVAGSGAVAVAGEVSRQEVSLTGAGQYRAESLESRVARLGVTGSGAARVHATETLDVTISGSGSVEYSGSPQVRQSVTGAGRLRQVST
jgi:hypothetical protein